MKVDPLELSRERPELSAITPIVLRQKLTLGLLCVVIVFLSYKYPMATAKGFVGVCTLFYVVFSAYKLLLVRLSVTHRSNVGVTDEEMAELRDEELPVYSIMVPMYDEAEVVESLVGSLEKLDYPADKKDVQLLVEEDDSDTRAAVEKLDLPIGFRVTLIEKSHPRTKPKACNIGLAEAKGKYLVIYDAEDRPDPDQLRKAVVAFGRLPKDVVCLQSMLNFYNPRQNMLSRWFTAEYSAWFDLSLPGLSAIGAAIPLGGTSNHFITDKLRELRGWDAFNVAEDCDLGIRIYRAGYKTRMLNTTTWEEACCDLSFWIRQRTRWMKGYMQTYFVHMRYPVTLLRELGVWSFFHFQMLIGGVVFSFLISPFYWMLALLWFVFRLGILTTLFPGVIFALGATCLFAGNFVFAYIGAVGCYQRGYHDLVKYSLLAPGCWVLMSYSGWRAFLQFFSNPFYWEKTKHGRAEES